MLEDLSSILGPSGHEHQVREFVAKEMKKHVSSVKIDKLGNLICHKKGKKKKIMLTAHLDEIGLMVQEILYDGKLRVTQIGGFDPITIVGQRVSVIGKNKSITGVVSFLELHEDIEIKNPPTIYKLYIDTGLGKAELKKHGIHVGSYVVPKQDLENLGNKDLISGKALDDRVGCYILIELAKKLKKSQYDIYYVFTVQEEIGLHGSRASAYEITPDWGIAIDTTSAQDAKHPKKIKLGGGPCIIVKDAKFISSEDINNQIESVAKKYKIPIQFKVDEFSMTDATSIFVTKGSVPSTALNIPVRNIHSSIGVASKKDIKNAISLLYYLLKIPSKKIK